MFEKATRLKLRFNCKGWCSVEDLWDLPLKSLDAIYKELNSKKREQQEDSLLETKSESNEVLDLQIDIIKHVFSVRLNEKKDREAAAEKASKKQKLLSLIAQKQDAALGELSVDELRKMVAEL